jgi:hypothetical protein
MKPSASYAFSATAQYVVVAVADGGGSTYRITGSLFPTMRDTALTGVPLYALSVASDAAWTSSAGLVGPTFADRGITVEIFEHGMMPVAGVQAYGESGASTQPWYFSDTDASTRSTIGPSRTATSNNGTLVLTGGSGLSTQTGAGAPAGCLFPAYPTDIVANAVLVHQFVAVEQSNPQVVCP